MRTTNLRSNKTAAKAPKKSFVMLQGEAQAMGYYLSKDMRATPSDRYQVFNLESGVTLAKFKNQDELAAWLEEQAASTTEATAPVEVTVETTTVETTTVETTTVETTTVETVAEVVAETAPEAAIETPEVEVPATTEVWDAEIEDLLPDLAPAAAEIEVATVEVEAIEVEAVPATVAATVTATPAATTADGDGFIPERVAKLEELELLAADVSAQGKKAIAQALRTSPARLSKWVKAYTIMAANDVVRTAYLRGKFTYTFLCETAIKRNGEQLLTEAANA